MGRKKLSQRQRRAKVSVAESFVFDVIDVWGARNHGMSREALITAAVQHYIVTVLQPLAEQGLLLPPASARPSRDKQTVEAAVASLARQGTEKGLAQVAPLVAGTLRNAAA